MSNFETWWEREGQEFLYALNTTTDDDIKLVAEVAWKNGAYCAEQAEQEPVGRWNWNEAKFEWLTKFDYHKHHMTPLYAAPQPVKQEPVHEALQIASVALQDIACSSQTENLYWWQLLARKAQKQIAECLTNAAPIEPVKQEPVAWVAEDVCDGQFINGRKRRIWWECIEGAGTPFYTHTVRTKDLTDDEITDLYFEGFSIGMLLDFARAVIAADRSKNK